MALSKEDRDLLAVVKYYNGQRNNIIKLVKKLGHELPLEDVCNMTGFTPSETTRLCNERPKVSRNRINNLGPSKATKKVQKSLHDEAKSVDLSAPVGEPIELTSDSPLWVRVTHDIAKAIQTELKPGDAMWGQKDACQKFEITTSTCAKAMKLLAKKGWIEKVDPNNQRSPYKVK